MCMHMCEGSMYMHICFSTHVYDFSSLVLLCHMQVAVFLESRKCFSEMLML